MLLFGRDKSKMVAEADALPGRSTAIANPGTHTVLGTPLAGPYPDGVEVAYFGMGCFWGAERLFWKTEGVYTTAVGYQGGYTPNPTYEETCTGKTGHTEAVLVAYDPSVVTYGELLKIFFEEHNPTQVNRQGNDVGSQYRSAIYTTTEAQLTEAQMAAKEFGGRLAEVGLGEIASEIVPAGEFFFAEDYHQQYLQKVPNGYCGLAGTGVSCPIGLLKDDGGA